MKKIFLCVLAIASIQAFGQKRKKLKLKKYRVSILDDKIEETSGLTFFNHQLYTINDGGNTPRLYQINQENGEIISTIKMPFDNKDWEAITASEKHLYIGDFGNNRGNRKALKIYQLNPDFSLSKAISFYYPEQKDFSRQTHRHNFDAESMVYHNGKLHLFTKEWKSKKTTHYIINPDITENQKAEKVEEFDLGYLATDASYYDGKLYIVGYNKRGKIFLTIFQENEEGLFFNSKFQQYKLGNGGKLGQVEGISINSDGMYISSEKMNYKLMKEPQSFYFVPKFNEVQYFEK